MYKFSEISKNKLSECHADLQLIMDKAISITNIDFGIAESYRSTAKQYRYFLQGKSKLDGITRKSKHNLRPSMAVDIFPFVNNTPNWDNEHLTYLSGVIQTVGALLLKSGKIKHSIRWGGNWDMDGTILIDQSFDDRPHFELIIKKTF